MYYVYTSLHMSALESKTTTTCNFICITSILLYICLPWRVRQQQLVTLYVLRLYFFTPVCLGEYDFLAGPIYQIWDLDITEAVFSANHGACICINAPFHDLPLVLSHSFADIFADDTTLSTDYVFRSSCVITNQWLR